MQRVRLLGFVDQLFFGLCNPYIHHSLFFAQSPNVSKAKGTKADPGKVSIGEDGDTQVNLAIERAKYKSFWVGVNRGINLDSKNPRVLEDEYKKKDSDEPVRNLLGMLVCCLSLLNVLFFLWVHR